MHDFQVVLVVSALDQCAVVGRLVVMTFMVMTMVASAGSEEATCGESEERSDYLFCFHGYEVGVKFWATSER